MKPIDEYVLLAPKENLGEYLEDGPPAVLITDVLNDDFMTLDGPPGLTGSRLKFRKCREDERDRRTTSSASYMVIPIGVTSRTGSERLLVGCGENCDVQIGEVSVSREHAWIVRESGEYFIEDNHSTGGICIDGKRLESSKAYRLETWSRLTLGSLELTFFDPAGFYMFVKKFGNS